MFSWTKHIPLKQVSSLYIQCSGYEGIRSVSIDARRGNAFCAIYDADDSLILDEALRATIDFTKAGLDITEDNYKPNMEKIVKKATLVKDVHALVPNYLRKQKPKGIKTMKIRKSIPSDLTNIKEIEQDNYGYILTEELINDNLHTHFILEDESFIGYISIWHDENKAQIESIIVNVKNNGYGQKLLKYALDYLNGYVITLEVRKSNSIAIHVYEKFGFKTVTIRKNYYKNNEDALLMLKEC